MSERYLDTCLQEQIKHAELQLGHLASQPNYGIAVLKVHASAQISAPTSYPSRPPAVTMSLLASQTPFTSNKLAAVLIWTA